MKKELDDAKLALVKKESTIADLNKCIEQMKHTIQEKENDLSSKENEIQESRGEDNKKLVSAMENISLLQKQKLDIKTESQKALQQISVEVTARSRELELERQEVTKFKERVLYLENVVDGKEKENKRSEESYRILYDKLQAAEVDMANSKMEWIKEKAVLEEKGRSLQGAMEVMKNDFKAMQHDYKKACELADMKSAEATDVIDKLESSQKQWRELQQRLSRTEAALGEKENSVTLVMREKDELLKEKQRKEDEAERKKQELDQLLTERVVEIEKLNEVLESTNLKLETMKVKCIEKEDEIEKMSLKLGSIESQYKKV
ncbi:tropomyosin-like [Stylophora pistillata]|uniref:tropomyosin-like n=1 Tax=Stylophora pistillata TaxID=50429 RepID=UPI000C03D301|nr:tropomyosin-like [Stylophora pistillata]